MLFLKRGFARLGSLLHIFLDHRKSQKKTKNKKSQKISKNLKIFQVCKKKATPKKKQEKTKYNQIQPNKLMQTYKNLGPSLRFLPCFLKQYNVIFCTASCSSQILCNLYDSVIVFFSQVRSKVVDAKFKKWQHSV